MKAAYIRKTGGTDVIEWGDLPDPKVKPNQVLVNITTVAASPIDTYIRSGKFKPEKPLPMPYIIGCDMVGVVTEVGSKVKDFKIGQKVWSNSCGSDGRQGSFAQYIAIDEEHVFHAPEGVDDKTIVSSIQAGLTACYGLLHAAMLRESDTIFVNGGSGNVGSAVIQIAKARGSTVFTSTSGPEKMEWCENLGADLVLDYRKNDLEKKVHAVLPEGVNVFWDTSSQPNFDTSVALVGKQGRIVLMAGAEARPQFPVGPFYRKGCSLRGFSLFNATPLELKQAAEIVNACLKQNLLKAKIAEVLPLSSAAKAHQMLEAHGDLWGKIILTV